MFEFDRIETPENVELERRLAGIGSRFLAGMLDHLLIIGLFGVLIVVLAVVGAFGGLGGRGPWAGLSWWIVAGLLVGFFLVNWGYFVLFEMVLNGQTPGKRRMKIRVVKDGGGPVTFMDIAIRNLMRAVDVIGFYAVAGISMFISRKVQRLGDLAAGTVVVSEQTVDYSAKTDKRAKAQWEREVSADALRATGLTAEEYRALSNYWARRQELTLDARRRVLPQLLRPLLERVGLADQQWPMERLEAYVDAMLAEADAAERRTAQEAAGLTGAPAPPATDVPSLGIEQRGAEEGPV